MDEKYRIKIPHSIDEEMSAWNIPEDIRRSMEDLLRNHLAADPVSMLVRIIGPDGDPLNIYEFMIPEQPNGNPIFVFMFHFLYGQDEKSLLLVAGDYERFDSDADDSSTPIL